MSDSVERFQKRRGVSKSVKLPQSEGPSEPTEISPDELLSSAMLHLDGEDESEALTAEALLAEIHGHLNAQKIDALIDSCQRECLQVIVRSFGVGRVIFEGHDKDGGNVTTTQNFKKGITANNADEAKYDDWQKRKSTTSRERRKPYLKDYKKKKDVDFEPDTPGIIDGYTGSPLEKNKTRVHWEHVHAVSKFEDSASLNLRMTEKERVALANSNENKTYTTDEINHSKNDKDLIDWYNSLSGEEKKHFNLDKKRIRNAYNKSRRHRTAKEAQAWIRKDGVEIVTTGVNEAGKMALQQALGVLMEEFTRATFDEVRDCWANGFKGSVDDSFLETLKERLARVAKRVLSKWKDAAYGLRDGFISGFFSNLITVMINIFATTAKKIVRMIREGVMSLYQAVKTLAFPDEGVSMAEAADAAMKILAGGIIVAGGLALEAALETYLEPLGPLKEFLLVISVGLATGVLTACTVFALDKADMFGVHGKAQHEKVLTRLTETINISYERSLEAAKMFDSPSLPHLS